MDYDAIIIGAGHNGLITAAYLAKAGYRVAVFERRHIVGGAVVTEEIIPGYQFDLGGSAHILIRLTPVVEELELESFGLNYIDVDPLFFAPFEDGDSLFFYRDLDKTVAHLETRLPGEGENYYEYIHKWKGFANIVKDTFLNTPSPFALGKAFIKNRKQTSDWQKVLPDIMRPYGEVVANHFKSSKLQAAIAWMAAQSGPPPTEPLSGPFALWHPLYHEGGIARPAGGSGQLTQALKRCILSHGGEVYTDHAATAIEVINGSASAVVIGKERYSARAIISAAHIHTTFGLLPPEHRPKEAAQLRIGNGFGIMLRLALDAPVTYACTPSPNARVGLQLICENIQQINSAYGRYLSGAFSKTPPIVAMTFSAIDDTLAPPGGEVLWLWGQYFPYTLSNASWAEVAQEAEQVLLDQYEKYAPGTKEKVIGSLLQTPEWLETNLGLLRGNVMHLEMSIDQMFFMRPFLGMSEYKTPIKRLFITGASTHPGGGIMGASGRNAARVVLKALSRKKI